MKDKNQPDRERKSEIRNFLTMTPTEKRKLTKIIDSAREHCIDYGVYGYQIPRRPSKEIVEAVRMLHKDVLEKESEFATFYRTNLQ